MDGWITKERRTNGSGLSSLPNMCYLSSFKDKETKEADTAPWEGQGLHPGHPRPEGLAPRAPQTGASPRGTQHASVLRKRACGGRKAGTLDGTEADGQSTGT